LKPIVHDATSVVLIAGRAPRDSTPDIAAVDR
jgi:hypothetical protein